jgi:hypothetical protein
MARTVKPFTKAQHKIVSDIEALLDETEALLDETSSELQRTRLEKDDAIDQLAGAAAFASEQADLRLKQLKDVTPRGHRIDVFVAVSGELVLRATKLLDNGVTDVQIHYLDSASAYALASDLEYAADELA